MSAITGARAGRRCRPRPRATSRSGSACSTTLSAFTCGWRSTPRSAHFKRHTGIPGLRPGWFAVLSLINNNPGITPLALSRASGRDKSTITPVLRDLVREQLISREDIPDRPAQLCAAPDRQGGAGARAPRRLRRRPRPRARRHRRRRGSRRCSISCAASQPSWTDPIGRRDPLQHRPPPFSTRWSRPASAMSSPTSAATTRRWSRRSPRRAPPAGRSPRSSPARTRWWRMSAAHGFAQVSGRPQAVLVHVECGTQALAGAVHNAARGRVPMLVFAGASPFTQEGELRGSRNEFIQWIQDVHDQRGIVRGYMKYDERDPHRRATSGSSSTGRCRSPHRDPKGPVYLMAAREVLEEALRRAGVRSGATGAPSPPLPLPRGRRGRDRSPPSPPRSGRWSSPPISGAARRRCAELVRFCEALGAGVLESVPVGDELPARPSALPGQPVERPAAEPGAGRGRLRAGDRQRRAVDPTVSRPAAGAADLPRRRRPAEGGDAALVHRRAPLAARRRRHRARAAQRHARRPADRRRGARASARAHYAAASARAPRRSRRGRRAAQGAITPEFLTACVRAAARCGQHRAERGDHQLRRSSRPSGDDAARLDLRLRRRLARLERRRRDRRQAGRPGARPWSR